MNSKCEYLQNCITRITVNEETWERKERERREEEKEKEDEERLEAFRREKVSIQQEGKRCQPSKKRKAIWLENDLDPGQHKPESGEEDSHLPGGRHHQHVEEGTDGPEGDLCQGLGDGGQHQHVAVEPNKPDGQHQNIEAGSTQPSLSPGMGLAVSSKRKNRGVGPSLNKMALGVANKRQAVTTPNPNTTVPGSGPNKMKKKGMDYNLNCWNLWWKRMEREGVKEGVDRKVMNLQRPASSYFTRPMRTKSDLEFENTPTIIKLQTGYLHATPVKRKSDLRMEPEISSHQSANESPAKRRKTKFMNLMKYWGGEKGRGADSTTQYMNTPLTINTQITARTAKLAELESSQLVVGGLKKSESGRQPEMDLEGEG